MGTTFIDSIHSHLQATNTMERQQSITSLRDLVCEDTYTNTTHPATDDEVACPHCGSLSVIHEGPDHDSIQAQVEQKIRVMTGVSDDGSTSLTMGGRGLLSFKRAITALDGKLAPSIIAVTDRTAAHPGPTNTRGVTLTWTEANDNGMRNWAHVMQPYMDYWGVTR